ncbi:hypothetical protein ACOME3_005523 [Neoechinorhynchus agilis]
MHRYYPSRLSSPQSIRTSTMASTKLTDQCLAIEAEYRKVLFRPKVQKPRKSKSRSTVKVELASPILQAVGQNRHRFAAFIVLFNEMEHELTSVRPPQNGVVLVLTPAASAWWIKRRTSRHDTSLINMANALVRKAIADNETVAVAAPSLRSVVLHDWQDDWGCVFDWIKQDNRLSPIYEVAVDGRAITEATFNRITEACKYQGPFVIRNVNLPMIGFDGRNFNISDSPFSRELEIIVRPSRSTKIFSSYGMEQLKNQLCVVMRARQRLPEMTDWSVITDLDEITWLFGFYLHFNNNRIPVLAKAFVIIGPPYGARLFIDDYDRCMDQQTIEVIKAAGMRISDYEEFWVCAEELKSSVAITKLVSHAVHVAVSTSAKVHVFKYSCVRLAMNTRSDEDVDKLRDFHVQHSMAFCSLIGELVRSNTNSRCRLTRSALKLATTQEIALQEELRTLNEKMETFKCGHLILPGGYQNALRDQRAFRYSDS